MKKHIKIVYILLILITIFMVSKPIYAATMCKTCSGSGIVGGAAPCPICGGDGWITETTHSAGEIISEAEGFIEKGQSNANDKIKPENLKDMSDMLYNILLVVGIIAAVIVGLIMGIKFIMGSIEEKAEIKAMLIPYIIGCVVVFGAFTIWKIVVDVLQSV